MLRAVLALCVAAVPAAAESTSGTPDVELPSTVSADACTDDARVLPETGAQVPANARIWVLGYRARAFVIEGGEPQIAFGVLASDYDRQRAVSVAPQLRPGAYVLTEEGAALSRVEVTRFTVGAIEDRTPPPPPVLSNARADMYRSAVDWVGGSLRVEVAAPDAVLVEVAVEPGPGAQHTPPSLSVPGSIQLHGRCGGFRAPSEPGAACIVVRSLDLAGNRSAPARTCVDIAIPPEQPRERNVGLLIPIVMGMMALVLFLPSYRGPKRLRRQSAVFQTGDVVANDVLARIAIHRRRVTSVLAAGFAAVATGVHVKGYEPTSVATIAIFAVLMLGFVVSYTYVLRLLASGRAIVRSGNGLLVVGFGIESKAGLDARVPSGGEPLYQPPQ